MKVSIFRVTLKNVLKSNICVRCFWLCYFNQNVHLTLNVLVCNSQLYRTGIWTNEFFVVVVFSNKCCYFYMYINQRIPVSQQEICFLSSKSHIKNPTLLPQIIYVLNIFTYKSYYNNVLQYFSIYLSFDQINAALVNISLLLKM